MALSRKRCISEEKNKKRCWTSSGTCYLTANEDKNINNEGKTPKEERRKKSWESETIIAVKQLTSFENEFS